MLAAAVVAPLVARAIFQALNRMPTSVRTRQIGRTSEDIVDLYDDVDPERDHIRGPHGAPVTLVEYGDFECPYCGQAETVIRDLLASFGDDVRYVWRHLPLNDVHPSAQLMAEAVEAAHAQGRFWEMYDALLLHEGSVTAPELGNIAERLGLDIERFWAELADSASPTVAFESPRRLPATLRSLADSDPGREVAVCRELTKRHEQVVRGAAAEVAALVSEPRKGEVTLVIGPGEGEPADEATASAAVGELVEAGLSRRQATDLVARLTGLPRRRLYDMSL